MKKWFLHILLIGILGTLAASCSQVMEDPISEGDCVVEKQKVMIRFTIALDAPKTASRTWAEDETQNDVTIDENYLNPNTVQVLVYDLNGILIGQLQDLTVTRQEDSSKQHIYDLVGGFEVDNDIITNNTLSFKLMVFGNCAPITNMNNLAELMFTNPNTTTGTGIPMWGIATYNNVTVYTTVAQAQSHPLTTPVYMLRSMAKIEVTLHEDMVSAGYTLDGATLSKSLTAGYVLPAYKNALGTELTLKNLTATTNLGIDEVFHPVTETASNITGNAEMTIASNTAIIYVPEYDATSENKLQITLDLGDTEEKSFFHGYYNPDGVCTSEVRDVIRNHYYKYTVNVDDGGELELTLIVNPWDVDEETIQFTDEVSISQKMTWTGSNITANTTDASILYINGSVDSNTAATVTFQIDTPVGATWYASFEGDKEAFAFLDANGNEVTSVSGEVGELATLRIVTTEEHVSEMKSVSLKIVVRTMDGRTIMVNKDLMPEALSNKEFYQIRQNLTV